MTDTERIAALESDVATLKAMLGVQYLNKSSDELKAALVPANTLPGGRYPYMLSDYQIRVGIAEIAAQKSAVQPAPVVQTPPVVPVATPVLPSAGTIAGLSASQAAGLVRALTNGVAAGIVQPGIRDRVQGEIAAGTYSYGVREVIDAVKLWYYFPATSQDQQAMYPYLQIIDQRDPNDRNLTLSIGDPRWKYVSGSAVSTVPQAPVPIDGSLQSQLTAMGFVFENGLLAAIKLTSFGAPEGTYYAYVGANDAALRLFAGISSKIGGEWKDGQNTNPNLPVVMYAIERDGCIGWDWIGSGKRKTWGTFLQGFRKGRGPRRDGTIGKYVDVCYWEDGRGVRFNTFPAGASEDGDISTALQLDPDNPNAVAIRIGNQLRRLTASGDTLTLGEVVDESQ